MKPSFEKLLELNGESCRLCQALTLCFQEERRLLVQFQTEALQINNGQKEELIREVAARRRELKALQAQMPAEALASPQWQAAQGEWSASWNRMRQHCEENQEFLQHSLKNLEMISDNLLRLVGQLSLYNNKGSKIDLSVHRPAGKVVEGTY